VLFLAHLHEQCQWCKWKVLLDFESLRAGAPVCEALWWLLQVSKVIIAFLD
jgi:hypothetical protein